ncbi:MAG: exodeoxyribonuclease V subunit gamma [Gammaproteobacteria bacterium]|nr:exodeoxyribonuclease V subunit gamma [Gammaproteobacteria bacterium]
MATNAVANARGGAGTRDPLPSRPASSRTARPPRRSGTAAGRRARHIAVIGLSTLPPIHLEALQALSHHIDVDLYFLNPCQHYWGDIVSEKDQARRSIRGMTGKTELADEDYLEVGNPLLSSWGKQGREFLELLLDTEDIVDAEFFEPPTGESMLAGIQRDILELSFGGEGGTGVTPEKRPTNARDLSVQIHVCHSKMREVEVLYDQLLRLFDEAPDLTPADVIVMTPDVADYAPFIEAVFPRSKLPYTIADRALGEESPVLLALSTLLSLPDSRLTSTEVMDLLEVPTIARRFELEDSDLQLMSRWIQASGIRWELDGEARAERWQVPATRENTWHFGIDRLLLGFAMREEDGIFGDILPCDVDSSEAGILGTFCDIIERISFYRDVLAKSHTASEWRDLVQQLMDDFFEAQGDEELDLASVRDLLILLEEETASTEFVESISPRLFRYWLNQQLSISQQSRGFISGGVTFATLVPMRSIPFRVVCLLGMNDGNYPRQDRPPTFDLMAREGYRRGDRSKRNDDRYLFLEALISAEDTFYVSYEGRASATIKKSPLPYSLANCRTTSIAPLITMQ